AQDAALDRLLKKDFAGTLLGYVHQVLALPPQPAPRVAPDFWEQFEMTARLGEIRKYRPSAYRALPKRAARSASAQETEATGLKPQPIAHSPKPIAQSPKPLR